MKKMKICIGSSCQVKGAYELVEILKELIEKNQIAIELEGSFCMGRCHDGVSIEYDDIIYSVSPQTIEKTFYELIGEK